MICFNLEDKYKLIVINNDISIITFSNLKYRKGKMNYSVCASLELLSLNNNSHILKFSSFSADVTST
jgi:hypothetical protein